MRSLIAEHTLQHPLTPTSRAPDQLEPQDSSEVTRRDPRRMPPKAELPRLCVWREHGLLQPAPPPRQLARRRRRPKLALPLALPIPNRHDLHPLTRQISPASIPVLPRQPKRRSPRVRRRRRPVRVVVPAVPASPEERDRLLLLVLLDGLLGARRAKAEAVALVRRALLVGLLLLARPGVGRRRRRRRGLGLLAGWRRRDGGLLAGGEVGGGLGWGGLGRDLCVALLGLWDAMKEAVADAAAEEALAAPGSVGDEDRLAGDVEVGVVDKQAERLVDVLDLESDRA